MSGRATCSGKRYLWWAVLALCLIVAMLSSAGCQKIDQAVGAALSRQTNQTSSTEDSSLSGRTKARNLAWSYRGARFCCQVTIPQSLLAWDRHIYRLTAGFYSGKYSQSDLYYMPSEFRQLVLADSLQEGGDLVPWVNDRHNSQVVSAVAGQLASYAHSRGFDYFHTAEFIQSFVCGAIPYQVTYAPELPAQTMMDNGDCKDKSILLAALLENLSYKVTLLEFPPQGGEAGHMAVGVAFSDNQIPGNKSLSYYQYRGHKYYFAETTAPNWTLGSASVNEPAHVYEAN